MRVQASCALVSVPFVYAGSGEEHVPPLVAASEEHSQTKEHQLQALELCFAS